jgi:uncharacterized protein YcbX
VRTPAALSSTSSTRRWREDLGHGARALKQDRGAFDALPLSVLTTQTVAALAAMAGRELDPRRFRPNLLVEATGDVPFAEDAWLGATLRVGELRLRADRRDPRCVVVNVDPARRRARSRGPAHDRPRARRLPGRLRPDRRAGPRRGRRPRRARALAPAHADRRSAWSPARAG